VDSVSAAWECALEAFDRGGREGVQRRHVFARDNHHVSARVREICEFILKFHSNENLTLVCDEQGVGVVAD
jgi:hypothetical protein